MYLLLHVLRRGCCEDALLSMVEFLGFGGFSCEGEVCLVTYSPRMIFVLQFFMV